MSDIFATIHGLCNRVKKLILENKTVTKKGVYGPSEGYDAIGTVVVDIPEPVLQEKTATENGDITADEGYDGLSKVKVDVDIPKTIIEPLTITKNGVYEAKAVTATELFDGANCVYDIPVELEDGTVLNFMKASKISSLLLASDDPNYKIDMQFSYYGDAVSINCLIGEVLEVDPDFLYDADGNLSIDYKIFNLNGLNNQFPFAFTEDLSKLALDVRDASRLAGTPFEGKFESGYVYFSDRLSQIPDISNWRVYITAPGFDSVTGYLPVTVDVPDNSAGIIERSATEIKCDSATSVGERAFQEYLGLTKVDLPNIVKVSPYAFDGCQILNTVILRNSVICELMDASAFTNTPIENGTGYIYVPAALIDSYKTATNWSTYAAQLRAIEDYPEITG